MNEISRTPAHTVTELASARQHQETPADHHGARGGGLTSRYNKLTATGVANWNLGLCVRARDR